MRTWNETIEAMTNTEQTSGLDMMQHGLSVASKYLDLLHHLRGKPLKGEWRLPEWMIQHSQLILENQIPISDAMDYLIYHDIGKPFCLNIDEEGKRHFPNHAKVSEEIASQHERTAHVSKIIGMDMDIHTLKSDGVEEFSKRPEAMTLILAAFAEIHSNAAMFGGIESTSFKIKYKHLDKRGRQVIEQILSRKQNQTI